MNNCFARLATIESVTSDDDISTGRKIHILKRILIRNNEDAMSYMMCLQNCPGTWIGPFDNTLIDCLINDISNVSSPKTKRCIDRLLKKPFNAWIYDGHNVRMKKSDDETSPYGAFPTKELCETFGCIRPILD
jgi:hypothetical protein